MWVVSYSHILLLNEMFDIEVSITLDYFNDLDHIEIMSDGQIILANTGYSNVVSIGYTTDFIIE